MRSKHFNTYIIFLLSLVIIIGMADIAESAPSLKLLPNILSGGSQYETYSATLTGSNGTTPYTWSLIGSLPPGLMFTPSASPSLTADISGTPIQVGTFSFTITLTDSGIPVQSVSNFYSITIGTGNCTFTGTTIGGISFSAIDPSTSPGPILGTVTQQILFTCKAGMAYTVTANPASGWTMASGGNTIPYTPGFIASGTGLGATPISLLTTNSQILQANYANAPAGSYANSQAVTLTISWVPGGGGAVSATIPAGGVSGSVITTCSVLQAAGALTFAIDPSSIGTTSAVISPDMQIKCTKNAGVAITSWSACGGAAPVLDSAYPACGGTKIPYTFNFMKNVTGQGFGTGISLNIGGSTTSANYENAAVGNYGDLQTLTITY